MDRTQPTELIIEAGRADRYYWQDIWRYRELLYFLAWRDILARYKQTVIGILWAVVRPLVTMVVFTVIFGGLADLPSDGVPYPILVFAALLPWQFFASSISSCSNSLVSNSRLISKIYFPRLIIPISSISVSFVDFLVSGMVMLGLMTWYVYVPSWRVIFLPFFIAIAACAALGGGLWISALNVRYRDFSNIMTYIIQIGTYISPVGFSSDVVPDQWRLLYSLNPMVGVIDGFRWAILAGDTQLFMPGFLLSIGLVILLLTTGIWFFRKTERTFADVI
jgi:lipopolysaccharide transport system permease protein